MDRNAARHNVGENDSGESSVVANVVGLGVMAYVATSRFDDSSIADNPSAAVTESKVAEPCASGEQKAVRSYGTLRHLMLKTLNALLADVEDIARVNGDVVKVGTSGNSMIAALYLEPEHAGRHRTLAILFDVYRRRSEADKAALLRYTISRDILTGCSCCDESMAEDCVHSDFISDDICIKVHATCCSPRREITQTGFYCAKSSCTGFAYSLFTM